MNFSNDSLAYVLKYTGSQLFLNTLDKVEGAKDLVLSKSILPLLDSICSMQKLRQNAVDKIFKLQETPILTKTINRIYVIRSSIEEVRLVANEVYEFLNQDGDQNNSSGIKFWIIFIPRLLHFCDLALEEEGIYEYISVLECPLGLIPIEHDLYSLEDDTSFSSLFLHGDITPLTHVVDSICQLQYLSGNITDVQGQGKFAKIVADKLDQANLTSELRPKNQSNEKGINNHIGFSGAPDADQIPSKVKPIPAFTDLYLVDRNCDYASALLSQLNYDGILDESFNLCCNKLEFSTKVGDREDKKIVKHSLTTDSDPIYRDIRDNHFSTVFSLIKSKNYEMKAKYNKSQEMNISNLKNFVANELKLLQAQVKCLAIHISACEEILKRRGKYDFSDQLRIEQDIIEGVEIRKCLDYITNIVTHQLDKHVPLRLLSLLSLTQGGLPPRDYKKYLSLYCENYGLFNNATFNTLKKLGLITEMNLSLNSLTGGLLSYGSNDTVPITQQSSRHNATPSTLSLASLTGAMSSLTERASGRVAAAVSISVLPRRGNLSIMLKKFHLVPEVGDAGYNIREPKDSAFVFGGAYIPLICKLIEHTVLPQTHKKAQQNMSPHELMKLLPGPNFKRNQIFPDEPSPDVKAAAAKRTDRTVLVYFIGGATFAEITALRFLAKERKIKIAIATTCIMNGNKLIDAVFPPEHNDIQTS